ncbi:hypothetical protein Bhyg_04756 [Pseudolycoriella hygida]|uniref:Uncharacterized protein n=1 Tax=Pseudolycoriella hygida TaxID=35572 RepID=A0A9Q0SAA0_9DIPT|nr:hypothetical protein Bhyg_04756 [Pseudolycoriella hygida]
MTTNALSSRGPSQVPCITIHIRIQNGSGVGNEQSGPADNLFQSEFGNLLFPIPTKFTFITHSIFRG